MRHKRIFVNSYLHIRIFTNSKKILKLINNFLDFNAVCLPAARIRVDFYLDEAVDKASGSKKRFFSRSHTDKDKNLVSYLGSRIASVKVNQRTGIVKGEILKFDESFKERALDFLFMQPLRSILAYHRLFFLHASLVCKSKGCVLITGYQDSGKSTLALVLAKKGFQLLSDDDCFVSQGKKQPVLYPFPTKIGVNDNFLKKFPEFNKRVLKNYIYGKKRRLSVESIPLLSSDNAKYYRCKMVIFPKYSTKGKISLRLLSKKNAFNRLAKESFAVYSKEMRQKFFWVLYNLMQTTSCFELVYNDNRLDDIAEIINRSFQPKS